MPAGFLIVFSEPGEQVSLEEFQDWYNNEHVPLRMNHLPSFLAGARFSAADFLKPSWVALYDINDTATFQHESYTRLRANRSTREADLVTRLEVLDRRTYELIYDSGESQLTSSLASRNPTEFIVTHGLASSEERGFRDWAEKNQDLLRGVAGWVRTRAYKCLESVRTGMAIAGKEHELQLVPRFLLVHELQGASAAQSDEFRAIIEAPEIVELRKWGLYRAYPGVAQGNLE